MSRQRPLRVETLDDRIVPASFGNTWPDGEGLTLSFAPSGTPISGVASTLAADPAARMEMLRAFQTWAVDAGVNFGLVADDASPFGTGTAVQGDPRFGDLRVGGIGLGNDVLAITTPYGTGDSYAGDVVVNTAAGFGLLDGPDLFTVLLQESGHALGVGNSPNPASAMYEYYSGPREGLAAEDVAAAVNLYGPRRPDAHEGLDGNDTPGNAAFYAGPLNAELTTQQDVDVYRFTTGLLVNGATVSLKAAGLSLVTAKVELLDHKGAVIATSTTTDPTDNDVTFTVAAGMLKTYYVHVTAARTDAFGVGAYHLAVTQSTPLGPILGLVDGLLDDTGLNDAIASATTLVSRTLAVGGQTEYAAEGGFDSSNDSDVYRIFVPPNPEGGPVSLVATVWGRNGAAVDPWISVLNATGTPQNADLLVASGNAATVQLAGVTPGQIYYLKLTSQSGAVGTYALSADVRPGEFAFSHGGTGTLDAAAPMAATSFDLLQSGLVHFAAAIDGTGAGIEMIVTDEAGNVVVQQIVQAGRGRSVTPMLPAGRYRLTLQSLDATKTYNYTLGASATSDPTGARAVDPTATPEQSGPNPPPPAPDSGESSDIKWDKDRDVVNAQWY